LREGEKLENLDANLSQLPSMFWARTLKKRTGWTYGKIQREYSLSFKKKNPAYESQYSRCMYKYDKGAKIRNGEFSEMIEAGLPGTKRLLNHPLWKILGNPNADIVQLSNFTEDLDLNVRQKLFTLDKRDGIYKRRELKKLKDIYYISLINNIDALACLLILIREFEIKKHIDPYNMCKWEAYLLLMRLALFQPLNSLIYPIYKLIYPSFIGKNYPIPKSFQTYLSIHHPEYFMPPRDININYFMKANQLILDEAIKINAISTDENEQLKFLFWVDASEKRREIFVALNKPSPANHSNLPSKGATEQINYVLRKMRGDSRSCLPGREFMYGKKYYIDG
jgi:hypothetical protein